MPNVGELRKLLNLAVDDTVDPGTAIGWFNSALRDLAPTAKIPAKIIIAIPGSPVLEQVLPANVVQVRSAVAVLDGIGEFSFESLRSAYGLQLNETTSIEWSKPIPSGSFVIRYYRTPVTLSSDSDVPEIIEPIHDALVHYAAREYFSADDEPELANQANAKYVSKLRQLEGIVDKRGMSTPTIIDARPPWARR